MTYSFDGQSLYRMPTHFGPSLGPRQGPDGRRYAVKDSSRQRLLTATFNVESSQLETLLPPGFTLPDDPYLSVDYCEITEIEWLAGRGYNTFGVSVSAIYEGQEETVRGMLLLVLWENMADPIITGREDLGFAKLYCELPPIRCLYGDAFAEASWDGHGFARLRFESGTTLDPASLSSADHDGTLHFKYVPRTGSPGEADVAYPVLTPRENPNLKIEKATQFDTASLQFVHSSWEQLPTLVNIVNRLEELQLGSCQSALMLETRGYKDLSDQRRVF